MNKILTENLYNLVIRNNAVRSDELVGITGFISSDFLSKQLEEYPDLKIKLYVGMTVFGVTESEHQKLVNLTNSYKDRLTVLYKMDFPANHMKVYEFRKNDRSKTYLGSANFSVNGFEKYIESMANVELRIEDLIEDSEWIDCREANPRFVKSPPPEEVAIDVEQNKQGLNGYTTDEEYSSRRKKLYRFSKPSISKKQKIQIMRKSDSPHVGINSVIPHIPIVRNVLSEKFFPSNADFELWFEKVLIKAKLAGDFKGELHWINPNVSEFLHQRMNVKDTDKITYDILCKHGFDYLYLEKVSDDKFIASFSGFNTLD